MICVRPPTQIPGCQPHGFGVRRVPYKNGEVDSTTFSAVSDMQLGA
jgi:hypothetical protein